jgi:hypothetical protein
MPHYLTNRGKLLIVGGLWDEAGASALRVGLLDGASIPTAIDTEAEIQDLNTVGELLALTGVDEPVAAWYTGQGTAGRLNMVRSNFTEDDTDNRAEADAGDLVWTSALTGNNIYGGFWYDATTDTNDTTRILGGVFLLPAVIPTNGSNLTLTIADFVRAV